MMRVGVGVLVAVACARSAAADGTSALDKPAMTATADELLALAKAAPAGEADVEVLRHDVDTSLDDRGCVTTRQRWVLAVRSTQDLDRWGTLEAAWYPSYQDRPTLRARVIGPAGAIVVLDPAVITDAPMLAATVNWRNVEAALPALQIGSVVEEETVTVDREPALGVGGIALSELRGEGQSASTVITLSAPAGRKAHQVARLLPAKARTSHRVEGGREIWRTELAALPALPWELDAPGDVITAPSLGLSILPSWAAVAAAYGAAIDKRIAEGPFALPAELPHTASIESLAAIARWLHRTVKSAPSDLAGPLRLPDPPAQIVQRGTGGNDDRAALLVSLARQAGMAADLVAVARGSQVPDPELPGLASFNHLLVRVRIAAREVWIDPSEPLLRPGELRSSDRDRRALVLARETRALSTTPSARAADNLVREVRTIVASETGPSQVTEVTRPTGELEREQRAWSQGAAATVARQAAEYARKEYDGGLVRRDVTAPDDLAIPSVLTLEVKDARRMYSDGDKIGVYLYPSAALGCLPWNVTRVDEHPRRTDFVWPTPHIYEVENRIVVPSGYTLPAPAPDRTRALGSASLTEHQEAAGQTFIVRFRFDSGKRRLTGAELAQLRTAVAGLLDEVEHVQIDLTSVALGDAGKPREAIAEARRMIALHPREALHHTQLASVLLHAGGGEAARREARQAVALQPDDPDALVALGWVLSYDTLGRLYGFDWDRSSALTALQKARKLAPSHLGAAAQLSEVALTNAHGRTFDVDADLGLALDAARDVLAIDKSDAHAIAVVKLLTWLGRYAEATTLAETVTEADKDKDPWLVVLAAAARGPGVAIQKARGLRSGAARRALIDQAAGMLLVLRLYGPARALYAETGSLARADAFDALLSSVAVRPSVPAVSKDPVDAARSVLLACADPARDARVFWSAAVAQRYRRECRALKLIHPTLTVGSLLADLSQSSISLTAEGDAAAWRVSGEIGKQTMRMYLALDHGSAKLLGDPTVWGAVGSHLASLLDQGRDDVARRVLSWLTEDLDPQLSSTYMFKQLWGPGLPTDRTQIQRATALLISEADGARAIALLGACSSTNASADKACLQVRLVAYYRARRWADFDREYLRMLAVDPTTRRAWRWRVWALLGLARFDDADRVLDDVLAGDPDDRDAKKLRISVAVLRGTPDEALRRADVLTAGAAPLAEELNVAAWLRVTLDRDLDGALDLARRAVALDGTTFGVLNTLAVVEVEHGDLAAAVADGWKATAATVHTAPRNADWYLLGRLYEQLGLAGDAITAYRRITIDDTIWGGAYELAARRLTALHASH